MALRPAVVEAVHLKGRIVRVGYPGTSADINLQGADHYRQDRWVPLLVELTNEDGDLFEGRLEVRQRDMDGDEVAAPWPVNVRDSRQYHLYVPAGITDVGTWSQEKFAFTVRVYDNSGGLAPLFDENDQPITRLLPPRQIRAVPNEALVALDISTPPLNQLSRLVGSGRLLRDLVVTRCGTPELPNSAAGLDMADVIVWDAADPSAIDQLQRDAILEWVQQGGTLVLGVGRNWELIQRSRFGEHLPTTLRGTTTTKRPPAELEAALYNDVALELTDSLTYCPFTANDLTPDTSPVVPPEAEPGQGVFVARRPVDRGQIVLVAAEMRDLFREGTSNDDFLRQVLGLRPVGNADEYSGYFQTDLFNPIEQFTGFRTTASIYFLFAFAFVIGYIAVATGGSWAVLKRRGLVQHSWTAFAGVALAASAVSLGAVQLIRGIGQSVQEVSIVDGRAGETRAAATCYFGLKTASHSVVDLVVPTRWEAPDESGALPGGLRPLPIDSIDHMASENLYAAGQTYEALAPIGQLADVPIRATLKQFEAQWRGELPGRIEANLSRQSGASAYLSQNSWVRNALDTDLADCYVLVAARNLAGGRVSRAMQVYVYEIGRLDRDERITMAEVAEAMKEKRRGRRAADEEEEREWTPESLSRYNAIWLQSLGVRQVYPNRFGRQQDERRVQIDASQFVSAVMLLTTFEEIDQRELADRGGVDRSQGQRLDRSLFLTRNTALLVGFSRDPGPARLCSRKGSRDIGGWDPIEPSTSHVVYRIALPVAE